MRVSVPSSPYKGLASFEDSELDALLFFGRERERDLITANLMAARLTVLYGASGVGKSSLLRAGVAHELGKAEHVVVGTSWSEDPLAVLDNAAAAAADGELFLILDQMEEFFLYHGSNGVTEDFAARLADLLRRQDAPVSVLLGIREDSVAKLDAFKPRLPNVLGNYLRLEHLQRRDARDAIVGPLLRYQELGGERFVAEAALVEAVLDEVSAERIGDGVPPGHVEAPYLQLVLQRLWEVERAAGSSVLRLETLRALGGAGRIVREHLERALAALSPAQQDAAASMFDHLVTPSGAKIAHGVGDLVSYARVDDAAAHGVIARLEGERILRPVEGAKVEIFHDVLAGPVAAWRRDREASREIGRARRRSRRLAALAAGSLVALAIVSVVAVYALGQRREAREKAALAQAALVSAKHEKQRAEASEADEIRARKDAERSTQKAKRSAQEARDALDRAEESEEEALVSAKKARESGNEARVALDRAEESEEEALVSAQKANESAEEANSQKRRADASARKARNKTRLATARLLVARSSAVIDTDPVQSIRWALRATHLEPSSITAEDALRDALAALRLRAVLLGGGGPLRTATFSPEYDSQYVATATLRGGVRLFNVNPGERIRAFKPYADVNDVAFSPDVHTLAAAARNGQALLWSVDTGALLKTLAHPGNVTAVEFTSDGQLVVTGGADGMLRVWESASGLPLKEIDAGGPVRSLSLQPGGRLAVVVTQDGSARVLGLVTGIVEADLTRPGGINVAAFSPDGEFVVAGGAEDAFLWNARGGGLVKTLEGHTSTITGIAFAPDNERVMTTSADSTARVWAIDTTRPVLTFTGLHQRGLLGGAVSSRNDSWATASADGTVGLWLEGTALALPVVLAARAGQVQRVQFSPDGWTILTASKDGNARLWRARDPNLHLVADQGALSAKTAFSPDGERLVTATADGTLRLFKADGGLVKKFAHGAAVNDIAFGGSGVFATGGQDGNAKLWRPDGSPQSTSIHGSLIRVVAVAPDGRRVATGGDDGRVVVFGAAGNRLHEFSQGAAVTSIEFASSDTLVSGGKDGSVAVWNVASGARRSLIGHSGAVGDIAVSRGYLLATASDDRTAHVYDLRTGRAEPIRTIQGHLQPVNVAAFSPDGRVLLTASRDGDVRTWKTKNWEGDVLRGHRGSETGARHTGALSGARFSPDGRWIVTAGPSAAGIWLTRSGDLLYFIRGHKTAVRAVTFAQDNRRVLTAGADGTMRDYRCDLCGELSALQRLANARLKLAARGRQSRPPR
jgi:WD40 repeat protein